MHTVGRVQPQLFAPFGFDHLIDRRGTKILARVAVLGYAAVGANVSILDQQVDGLIFFVAGAGVVDVGHLVEGQRAVGLDWRRLRRRKFRQPFVVLMAGAVAVAVAQAAPASNLLQGRMREPPPEAVLKTLVEVAHSPELLLHPTGLDPLRKSFQYAG